MNTTLTDRPAVGTRAATTELVRAEAWRMLRHPAPWLGLLLTAWMVRDASTALWASGQYEGTLAAFAPLLLGLSMASATTFARQRTALAEDAPLGDDRRAVARLLAGLPLVGLVALVVAGGAAYLRITGGMRLGDVPGMTLHAHYSLPELLQPVLLGGFAVALGAAVVHLVRSHLAAQALLFVTWFLVGASYWMFQGPVVKLLTPLQTQPSHVDVAPSTTDPGTFPADWLLSQPGEYQAEWVRLVVSPELAAWHDLYLVAVTALLVAAVVPGRVRRLLLPLGGALAVVAVVLQAVVAP